MKWLAYIVVRAKGLGMRLRGLLSWTKSDSSGQVCTLSWLRSNGPMGLLENLELSSFVLKPESSSAGLTTKPIDCKPGSLETRWEGFWIAWTLLSEMAAETGGPPAQLEGTEKRARRG